MSNKSLGIKSLRTKMLSAILFITLTPLVVVNVWNYLSTKAMLTAEIDAQLLRVAQRTARLRTCGSTGASRT